MIYKSPFSSSYIFAHLSPSLIKLSTENFPWNKTDKTPTFTGILPHVTILTILEAIRKYQDGMADKLSVNIVADLRKRRTFGGFSKKRIQSVLAVMRNKIEHDLKDSQKMAGQLEERSD